MSIEKLALTRDETIWQRIERLRISRLDVLAPKFLDAIHNALADLDGQFIRLGPLVVLLDWYVFETLRTEELQKIYYAQGTTNASTAARSWHKYGLAVDGISLRFKWFNNGAAKAIWPVDKDREAYATEWFLECGSYFEKYGCKLGAKWKHPDLPHIQWGKCADSPILAPVLYLEGGNQKVWEAVKAI